MNEYTCREVDEQLAAYAASGLDEAESCAVANHLAECRRHDGELTGVRADFERLAASVQPVEPPPRLRNSLLTAFDEAIADPEPAPIRVHTARPKSIFSTSGFAYAVASAMLALAVGVGAWGLSRDGGNNDVIVAQSSTGDASMQVTYVPDQQVAVMEVDLPPLPAGRVYQAWRIDGGSPVSLGLVETTSGSVAMIGDLEGASAVALSVEPTGGSTAPTTNPILIATLPRS
jgi:anti-sigma-K factor RskA